MFDIAQRFWNDEAGFVLSSELVLVSTIGVLGLTAGLSEVSQNVNGELHDVGTAFTRLDQSRSTSLTGNSGREPVDFDIQ